MLASDAHTVNVGCRYTPLRIKCTLRIGGFLGQQPVIAAGPSAITQRLVNFPPRREFEIDLLADLSCPLEMQGEILDGRLSGSKSEQRKAYLFERGYGFRESFSGLAAFAQKVRVIFQAANDLRHVGQLRSLGRRQVIV